LIFLTKVSYVQFIYSKMDNHRLTEKHRIELEELQKQEDESYKNSLKSLDESKKELDRIKNTTAWKFMNREVHSITPTLVSCVALYYIFKTYKKVRF